MKKFFSFLLFLLFMVTSTICNAEYFCVQRSDTDIFVYRSSLSNSHKQYLEIQRMINYNTKDNIFLHIRTFDKDFNTVTLIDKTNGSKLKLVEKTITHNFWLPKNAQDRWFQFDKSFFDNLKTNKKGYAKVDCVFGGGKKEFTRTCELNKEIIKNLSESSTQTLRQHKNSSFTDIKSCEYEYDTIYYRLPYFTLSFPGKSYNDIKERICYYLNSHKNNYDIDYSNYVSTYAYNDNAKMIGFKTLDFDKRFEANNFIWFAENSNGTILYYTANQYNKNNHRINDCLIENNYNCQRSTYHTFDVIKKVYEELYGKKDYGFTLKKYKTYDKNNFYIEKITNVPELKNITQNTNDQIKIIAINGISTENMSGLDFDLSTVYQSTSLPIEFKFLNTKNKQTRTIRIKPQITNQTKTIINYSIVNQKNKNAILENKSPLDFCYPEYFSLDIFDPSISSSEGIKIVNTVNVGFVPSSFEDLMKMQFSFEDWR